MDKTAEIQRDKKGNVIFDKTTAETEVVNIEEDIESYMAREIWPYVPDAVWFFEENMGAKKPVIKTGADIPFSRKFYQYQVLEKSDDIERTILSLEQEIGSRIRNLFGEV